VDYLIECANLTNVETIKKKYMKNKDENIHKDTVYWVIFALGVIFVLGVFYIKLSQELKFEYETVDTTTFPEISMQKEIDNKTAKN
jgi:hypothetical protein